MFMGVLGIARLGNLKPLDKGERTTGLGSGHRHRSNKSESAVSWSFRLAVSPFEMDGSFDLRAIDHS